MFMIDWDLDELIFGWMGVSSRGLLGLWSPGVFGVAGVGAGDFGFESAKKFAQFSTLLLMLLKIFSLRLGSFEILPAFPPPKIGLFSSCRFQNTFSSFSLSPSSAALPPLTLRLTLPLTAPLGVSPPPITLSLPTFLPFPFPVIFSYPLETFSPPPQN